ncbi:hypothetical protein TRFO_12661 [Tritrichomonas foetus]|uniref:Uncharacterized protein n=1 Tax=Tritrichomonas foetus TaxID=1144522 RepID=A0A1J4L5C1_9EUKA|nr:hypothetical protein TRFO_12661 [Tritrichomonas foetus]|eukprot:OHT17133.1 hypothetical protein TRFO_12661 [Tritrichomonas foetus]
MEINADLTKKYKDNQDLLHIACQQCSYPIAHALLKKGFVPDQPDSNGNTPLHFATAYEEDEEDKYQIIKELIRNGCDPSQTNRIGKCPFTMANRKTMEIIGNLMADPNTALAIQKRAQYWEEYRINQMEERINQRLKLRMSGYQTTKKTAQLTEAEKSRKNAQMATMTMRGGTLRTTAPKNVRNNANLVKTSAVRPWGGSKETAQFQRDIRIKLRNMKKALYQRLSDMLLDAKELKAMVFAENDYEEEDNEDIEVNRDDEYDEDEYINEQPAPYDTTENDYYDTQNNETSNPPADESQTFQESGKKIAQSQPSPEALQVEDENPPTLAEAKTYQGQINITPEEDQQTPQADTVNDDSIPQPEGENEKASQGNLQPVPATDENQPPSPDTQIPQQQSE